jgi:RHS repeat-associated protein
LSATVIRIYDGAGAVVANYNYDAWGNVISVTDANGTAITDSTHIANVNPLRYRGYYYDSETGLYYLQSRYYDPAVKRFINADDSNILLDDQGNILQYNLFAYCFDNPVNMYDEDGHYAASLTKRALSLGVTMSTLLLALKLLGLSNAWNVAGWVILGVVAAITVGVVGYKIYKSSKSKKTKKTAKKSGKEKANDAPDWAKRQRYDPNKSADRNARDVLDKKYGKGNYKTGPNSEHSKIKKWLQRDKGYK